MCSLNQQVADSITCYYLGPDPVLTACQQSSMPIPLMNREVDIAGTLWNSRIVHIALTLEKVTNVQNCNLKGATLSKIRFLGPRSGPRRRVLCRVWLLWRCHFVYYLDMSQSKQMHFFNICKGFQKLSTWRINDDQCMDEWISMHGLMNISYDEVIWTR